MPAAKNELNAVIYARYSSHSQTEQSIEGQLHDGYAFAEKCGYRVIGEYIDRALTGTKDDRPEFQRLIKDSERHQFQIVIVWKLDRFARNRYDSAIYKRMLKKNGVRVVSVMENITDSPEGIILEGLLESMAEYYSANLSENIRRGQAASLVKGWYPGGPVPYGYKLIDHHLLPDERTAPIVLEIYKRYADGESLKAIASDLNSRGYRTRKNHLFVVSSFDAIIPNPVYIGQYTYAGHVYPDVAPALVPDDIYQATLARRERNKRAPGSYSARAEYLLTGKAFCGLCGAPMVGDCGTSKTGARYNYYSCALHKRQKTGCRKKSEKSDFLEWYVCEQTVKYILDPERMDYIAGAVVDLYNDDIDNTRLKALENTVKRLNDELNALVDKLIYAPKDSAKRIGEKMEQLEAQRIDAETDLSKLRMQQKIPLTKKEVAAWLSSFQYGDLMDLSFRRYVIDTFINSVYLYDDKVVIFYNIKDGQQTSGIGPIEEYNELDECSTLSGETPQIPVKVEPGTPYLIFLHGRLGLVIFR